MTTSTASSRSRSRLFGDRGPTPDPSAGRAPIHCPSYFYGWVMLPVATVGMIATSPAQTFGVSMFNDAIRSSLGLSLAELTGAYMLGTFLAALPMTYVGGLMDRFGPRATMTAVVILFGLACLGLSQVTGVLTLFVAFFFLRLFGQGALGLISNNTLALWFNRWLGRANAVRQLGFAGAIAVVPGINLWLIDTVGWRAAYAVLGLAVWAVMVPLLVLVFRNRPEDVGQLPDGDAFTAGQGTDAAADEPHFTLREAWRTRAYWIAATITALWAMLATAVFFNLVPICEAAGLTEADAAATFTTFALTLAVMQLVGGILADFLPLNVLLAVATAALVAAMGVVDALSAPWMVHLFGIAMGAAQGLVTSTATPLWLRYYGRPHLGKIRGSLSTVAVAASSVGPFLVGTAHDMLGGYEQILTVFVVLPVPMVVVALFATPPRHPPDRRPV